MSFNEWITIQATDYCIKVADGTHDSPKRTDNGKPLITSKHIKGKSIDFTSAYLISENDFTKINQRSKVDKWDVLISMIGEYCGYCYVEVNDKIDYAVKNVGIFKTGERTKAYWLYYYLTSPIGKEILKSLRGGTSQPYISLGALRGLNIQVPTEEKKMVKIVSILSSLDDKIELNRKTNQTLEAIAQALFKEWFVDFNFPGATGEMQKSEMGEIPRGWRVVSFEEQADAVRGLSYKGAGLVSSNATPMHNLNSVFEGGGYKNDGIKFYKGDFKDRHIVKSGEVIVANTEQGHKYRLIGYPALIPSFHGEIGIFSHHIYRLRPKEQSYITTEFIFHLLLQPHIREQVIGFANGTTVNMLKIEGLQKPKFVMPPKLLVEKFTAIAKVGRQKAEQIIEENSTLSNLRDTLLPKLMKGEVNIIENKTAATI